MTNNIKLGTLVKVSATTSFRLHDIQYDITEYYTKSQILNNKQLSKMKVIQFYNIVGKNMLHVDVEEQKRGTKMLYKNRKMSQSEIDEIYENFVIEIATKVARQVKGKVCYGFASVEDMWYVIVKTRELGEKRFFLDTLDYDMLNGVLPNEIADNIVKFYRKIIERRFFII